MTRTTTPALAALIALALAAGSAAGAQDREPGAELARSAAGSAALTTIPPGTDIPVTLDEDIPIERDRFGERFPAHVTRDVVVRGEVVIPQGAPAEVTLMPIDTTAEDVEKTRQATLRLSEVRIDGRMRAVSTDVARADTEKRGWSTRKKTGAGAVAGAVVGAVTGAGILKGAIVGAGGGLAWGLLDGADTKVDKDTPLRFSLEQEVAVP